MQVPLFIIFFASFYVQIFSVQDVMKLIDMHELLVVFTIITLIFSKFRRVRLLGTKRFYVLIQMLN